MSQGAPVTVTSIGVSQIFGTKHFDTIAAEHLKIGLIGPDEKRRAAVAKALDATHRVTTLEYDSYPPETDHLPELMASFDVIMLDLDSDPDVALDIVAKMCTSVTTTTMVYSKNSDPKLAIRTMRAGALEYLLLPFERGAVAEALDRAVTAQHEKAITTPVEKVLPIEEAPGQLHVFVGSKGGAGVTTVACNMAIALAQNSHQNVLLIDFALPIGDAALCLGISAGYSTEDALGSIDRMDASSLQDLVVRHRSGAFVLAAPTKVPEIEFSKDAIDKLIAIARREFDHVIVDVGSRIDAAAKALFEDASTIFLVTQAGISELRNANHLISQFFAEGNPNLEIVINRFDFRFVEAVNEDVIAKALGRPVNWKIPDDQDAASALQYDDTGLRETRISRISLEMARCITDRPPSPGKMGDSALGVCDGDIAHINSEVPGSQNAKSAALEDTRATPTITWPTPDMITYGSKLTFDQLNATSSVKGTLLYTPGPGYVLPAGTHTLWVTFTPADAGSYIPVQAATLIVVAKATPAVSWPAPAEILYGTALSDAQLNASASVPGRFEYVPARGTALAPGMHTLSLSFTPEENANYATTLITVPLSVVRAKCEIQWSAPNAITYGAKLSVAQLCAESSVPGSFVYNPGLGAVLAAGNHKLSAVFSPEDAMVYAATQAAVSLTVAKAIPAVTWPTPNPIAYGTALGANELNAASTVPGSFAFAPAAGEILTPGVHEVAVTFTPADTLNYVTVRAVVSLTVTEKLSPSIVWPVPSQISYGTALSETQLNATASVPGEFAYTPAAGHVLAPGRYTLSATLTPSDCNRYAKAQAAVVLDVEELPEDALSPSGAAEALSAPAFAVVTSPIGSSGSRHGTGEHLETETKPPDTLPEDSSNWDSKDSLAPLPVISGGLDERQAAHSFGETDKSQILSPDTDAILESLLERQQVSGSASSAPVFVNQQKEFVDWKSEALSAQPRIQSGKMDAGEGEHPSGEDAKPPEQANDCNATATPAASGPGVAESVSVEATSIEQHEVSQDQERVAAEKRLPVNASEWEAWEADHSLSMPPRASGQGADRHASATHSADLPGVSTASSVTVPGKKLESTNEVVQGSHGDAAQGSAGRLVAGGTSGPQESTGTTRREADHALFQTLSLKNFEDQDDGEAAKKKWRIVGSTAAGALLCLLIVTISMFHRGTKTEMKPAIQAPAAITDTEQEASPSNPLPSGPVTEQKPPATTQKQKKANQQSTNDGKGTKPAQAQSEMMNDQLNAPRVISRDAQKHVAEDEPPPTSSGADGLGGTGANVSALNGHAQP